MQRQPELHGHEPPPADEPPTDGRGLLEHATAGRSGPDSGTPLQGAALGTNGRCIAGGGNIAGLYCSYDACATDSDCAAATGGVCECGAALGNGGRAGNSCLTGNCSVDSDCGAGGYCSPSLGSCGSFGGTIGYYCHTSSDTCSNDSDCVEGGMGYCAFQPTVGRWACAYAVCVG